MKRVFSCVVAASLALSLLVGCGASSTASSAASSAASSEAASSVASSAAETAALPDGVYTAEFDTDSSMFHANEACDGKGTLTVENGQMTFHVSLASTHIVNLYLGKASDAADHEADWLQPTTDTVTYSDGTSEEVYGFDIPVSAVDADFDLAILGTKGKWYDHVVSVRDAVENYSEPTRVTTSLSTGGTIVVTIGGIDFPISGGGEVGVTKTVRYGICPSKDNNCCAKSHLSVIQEL